MKKIVGVVAGVLMTLMGVAAFSPVAAADTSCIYQVRVLPGAPGSDGSGVVYGVTRRRSIAVGSAAGIPVYWKNGAIKTVPLPKGYTSGRVTAVNDSGLMVGAVAGPTLGSRAFRYRYGQRGIKLYPKGEIATAVNNRGRAVGYDADHGYEYWHGTRVRRTLALPKGADLRAITGINDANRIVGHGLVLATEAGSETAAWEWSGGSPLPTELGPVGHEGDTYRDVSALGIDARGHIVGHDVDTRVDMGQAVYWSSPRADLVGAPNLAGSPSASFNAISPKKLIIVGEADGGWIDEPVYAFSPSSAVLWRGQGPLTQLPSLATTGDASANAVDVSGRVGGSAVDSTGTTRPVLWTCGGN